MGMSSTDMAFLSNVQSSLIMEGIVITWLLSRLQEQGGDGGSHSVGAVASSGWFESDVHSFVDLFIRYFSEFVLKTDNVLRLCRQCRIPMNKQAPSQDAKWERRQMWCLDLG